jgi:hypothetical protein
VSDSELLSFIDNIVRPFECQINWPNYPANEQSFYDPPATTLTLQDLTIAFLYSHAKPTCRNLPELQEKMRQILQQVERVFESM